ncbi:MAG: VOC family protein [Synergistaceae bacterium]|jgi:lactoylglutathione lyase|nr:VOC family protein [Synergistaceae bacterium]
MKAKFLHTNINVLNLERSEAFYERALGLKAVRRKEGNGFVLVFLGDGTTEYRIELTWLADRKEPYDLGDNETHIAFEVDDFEAAHKLHSDMECICYENKDMGIYFIEDPDGYWLEIIPRRD